MTVIRPCSLEIIDVDIEFNFLKFYKLEIDLQHINRGKYLTRTTNFPIEVVADLVSHFLDGKVMEINEKKYYGDENCDYFFMTNEFLGSFYKLVFCICSDREETIGIITLYKIRR